MLLVRHGSHAYGTNIEGSDEDFKDICSPPKEYYLGIGHNFEQAELNDPDTVIYEIRKFFNLALQNNPNIIEILFTNPSDHIIVSDLGKIIIDNKDKFLSKRIRYTMGGYAKAQLNRIKLHRKYILNPPISPPSRKEMGLPEQTLIPQDQLIAVEADIQKELDKLNFNLDGVNEATKIEIRDVMTRMLAEMKITADIQWTSIARKIGLDDNFIEIMQRERTYKNQKLNWDNFIKWQTTRNKERYETEIKYGFDSKNAYHLVRLLRMAKEILETGKVIVKRHDKEELLAIRNGAWTYDQVLEYADQMDKELTYLYEISSLPKTPDINYLDNLCVELIERCNERFFY